MSFVLAKRGEPVVPEVNVISPKLTGKGIVPVVVAAPVETKKPEPVATPVAAANNNKKETAIVKKAPVPVSEDSFDMGIPDFGEAFDNEP